MAALCSTSTPITPSDPTTTTTTTTTTTKDPIGNTIGSEEKENSSLESSQIITVKQVMSQQTKRNYSTLDTFTSDTDVNTETTTSSTMSNTLPKNIVPSKRIKQRKNTQKQSKHEEYLTEIKSHVFAKLTQKAETQLHKRSSQFQGLFDILSNTIQTGENNSVLLIGPHSSGKSATLRCILAQNSIARSFCLVYLDGKVHSSDKAVLSQLNNELKLDLDEFIRSNNVTNGDDNSGGVTCGNGGNLSIAALFVAIFQKLSMRSKPTLYVLDNFDLFADHPKQMLLYNLFDMIQHQKNYSAVIGLTRRIDVLDKFEKRVKSRFSHRFIYFDLPCVFGDFLKIIENAMSLSDLNIHDDYKHPFRDEVVELFKKREFKEAGERIFETDKNVVTFMHSILPALAAYTLENPTLCPLIIQKTVESQLQDHKIVTLRSISQLELCLVISMIKYSEDTDIQQANFELVYDIYKRFASVHNMTQKKVVSLLAWDNLAKCDLLKPVDSISKCPPEYRMFKMLVLPEQVRVAVKTFPDTLNIVIKRWIDEK